MENTYLQEANYFLESEEEAGDELGAIYDNYVNGNISDFRTSFETPASLATFLLYVMDLGVDVEKIKKMLSLIEQV